MFSYIRESPFSNALLFGSILLSLYYSLGITVNINVIGTISSTSSPFNLLWIPLCWLMNSVNGRKHCSSGPSPSWTSNNKISIPFLFNFIYSHWCFSSFRSTFVEWSALEGPTQKEFIVEMHRPLFQLQSNKSISESKDYRSIQQHHSPCYLLILLNSTQFIAPLIQYNYSRLYELLPP